MRHLIPAVATLADTLCALGADDPAAVAQALHDGACSRCIAGDDQFPCDGAPTIQQHIMARAFVISLALIADQAAPRCRAGRVVPGAP